MDIFWSEKKPVSQILPPRDDIFFILNHSLVRYVNWPINLCLLLNRLTEPKVSAKAELTAAEREEEVEPDSVSDVSSYRSDSDFSDEEFTLSGEESEEEDSPSNVKAK